MKKYLALLLLVSSIAQAEVIKLECPPSNKIGLVQTCYHLGDLSAEPLGVSVSGSSCTKSSLRSTAPLYFQDSYVFTLSNEANVHLNLQARTTNRLRISLYTPTIKIDGINALANGLYPDYNFQTLGANQYVVTVNGVGTGVGSGICGYTAKFNID